MVAPLENAEPATISIHNYQRCSHFKGSNKMHLSHKQTMASPFTGRPKKFSFHKMHLGYEQTMAVQACQRRSHFKGSNIIMHLEQTMAAPFTGRPTKSITFQGVISTINKAWLPHYRKVITT